MNWVLLYEAHGGMRTVERDLIDALRQRLIRLADGRHCDRTVRGRFTHKTGQSGLTEFLLTPTGVESLAGLATLTDARLTLMAKVDQRRTHLHQFTAMVEGTTIDDGLPWAAAVHLESDLEAAERDRKGSGACGHAAFHCHIGPTLDHEPKVRVPLPALGPVAALDWLLAMVIPEWEPAPWASLPPTSPARR